MRSEQTFLVKQFDGLADSHAPNAQFALELFDSRDAIADIPSSILDAASKHGRDLEV